MTYQMGQKLGNYRLVRLLGNGGFAEVYLAKHIYLQTQAAIKVLQIQLTEDALQSFLQEARIIANLEHTNIIHVLEFGIENQRPYLVMNYAPNGTLRQRYPRGKQLSPATVLTLLKQIVAALDYAHTRKIIHRDVKPENMLFSANNTVLLSDFGLALEGHSASSSPPVDKAGTMLYMAPEQFRGQPCAASDQYALGIVVYEWLSGTVPFTGDGLAVAVQHAQALPTPLHERVPALPIALSNVVMRSLQKEPQARFAQIQEFAAAFEEACQVHAALFNSSASTQLLAESVVEAQSAHISADTLAHISFVEAIQEHSSKPELRFSQRDGLLNNQTLSSNKKAQVSSDADEMTMPVASERNGRENDTSETLFVGPLAQRQNRRQRRRMLLCGLACVGLLLCCLGVFWERETQHSVPTPQNMVNSSSHTPYPVSTRVQRGSDRLKAIRKIGSPVQQATNTSDTGATEPFQANQIAATPTPGLTSITAYTTPLITAPSATAVSQANTPSPTPTPQPINPPTPTAASSQPGEALSVSLSNVPNVVQNDSTVAVQVVTNQGNCDVRLRVIYSASTQIYRSDLYRTDSNGNAAINWNVNIAHSQIKYTVATLIVTAYNTHGETIVSLPVVVQII